MGHGLRRYFRVKSRNTNGPLDGRFRHRHVVSGNPFQVHQILPPDGSSKSSQMVDFDFSPCYTRITQSAISAQTEHPSLTAIFNPALATSYRRSDSAGRQAVLEGGLFRGLFPR